MERGTRLVLRTAHRTVPLRTLERVVLDGAWTVPVMADALLGAVRGVMEAHLMAGVVSTEAEVLRSGTGMVLRAVRDGGIQRVQRRAYVRVELELGVRAAVLAGAPGCPEEFGGATVSIGGGGVSIAWEGLISLRAGARLFVELHLPDGSVAPAVVRVVAADGATARVSFLDIAPIDVERLVGLVFRAQRRRLAARRRGR